MNWRPIQVFLLATFPAGIFLSLTCGESQTQSVHRNLVITEPDEPLAGPDSTKIRYITGRFDPENHPDFTIIPLSYADRRDMYLHREALGAFQRMHAAAKLAGINLKIISATRNFAAQKHIWEEKWTGKRPVTGTPDILQITDLAERAKRILLYSSMPGTSRHHWGTDIDLNALDNVYFSQGTGLKIYNWLQAHAFEYGFCQPYTAIGPERPAGYQEEKWHWSYRPVSDSLTNYAAKHLKDTDIQGFLGSTTAGQLQIVKHYVLGINRQCISQGVAH